MAIELKVGEFAPEFVGKVQFYLTALDRQVREKGENPSIGIILCKEKNRTVVEYALLEARQPIGVAAYRIVKRLPKELKGELPGPAEIEKFLGDGIEMPADLGEADGGSGSPDDQRALSSHGPPVRRRRL